MHRLPAAAFVLIVAGSLGCQDPGPPAGPTLARVSVTDDLEFDRLWESATDVLRAHQLEPDRQDRQARVITTVPSTSPQWFEFWQPFPTSDFGRAEANIQTMRRVAEIRFEPAARAGEFDLTVRVDVERYCLLERQATSAASAFQLFGAKLPTVEGRQESRRSGAYWQPLGRDEKMESALLDRVLRRYGGEGYRVFESAEPPTTQASAMNR